VDRRPGRLGRLYERYTLQFGRINDSRTVVDSVDEDGTPVSSRELRAPRQIRRDPG
jgi:hypothetical protein